MEHTDFLYWTALHPELYHINSPYRLLCGYWTNGVFPRPLYFQKKQRILDSGNLPIGRILCQPYFESFPINYSQPV